MDANIFLAFLIWGILTVILLLRKSLSSLARLLLILAFALHAFFWFPEISASAKVLTQIRIKEIFSILISIGKEGVTFLYWLWPLSLAYLFYLSSDEDSGVVVVMLSVLTALLWFFYYLSFV